MITLSPDEITEAFTSLRAMTDPRGHGLLDALERVVRIDALTLELVRTAIEMPVDSKDEPRSNVVPLIKEWSVKA